MVFLGLLCIVASFAYVFGFVWSPILWAIFSVCALIYGFFDDSPGYDDGG